MTSVSRPRRPRLGRTRAWWGRRSRVTKISLLAGAGGLAVLFVVGVGIVYAATRIPLPDHVVIPQSIQLKYADGSSFASSGSVDRIDVTLGEVPKLVQQAVIDAEDRNFYHEAGISPRGIARALYADITGGAIREGGSTITQQYAKNAYLTQ